MGRRGLTLLAATLVTVVASGAIIAGSAAGILPSMPGWAELLELPSAVGDGPSSTVPEASYPPAMDVADVYAAFTAGGSARSYGDAVTLSTVDAGLVHLPSGRLVATDAMLPDAEPFIDTVPPGRHPVTLLTADFVAIDDHRVAAAMLRVQPGDPVRWAPALTPGQDPEDLGPDEIFGFPVDSGTGAFTSPEAIAILGDAAAYDPYSERLQDAMFPDDATIIDGVAVDVRPDGDANVVAFSTGFGDGWYPTSVGFDARGAPVVFIADFGLLDAPGS